jgi:transcriptional regulator GlxA family with amidase domain
MWWNRAMRIAVHAPDDVSMFNLGVPQMVFGDVRRLGPDRPWETFLWTTTGVAPTTQEGYTVGPVEDAAAALEADLLVLPAWPESLPGAGERMIEVLRASHRAGTPILGLCLGAFPLAEAGLLDGRTAVTHWSAMAELHRRHPAVEVSDSVLYVDHGDVLTSAGTAAGIDACLHVVRTRLGAHAASRLARGLVVAPHREGGQAQYVERPVPEAGGTPVGDVLAWALDHLDESLGVDVLAARAAMSRRSFVRHFRDATGTTPAGWVLERRLDRARELLETTSWTVDRVAAACGFGSEVTLRQNFSARLGTTPARYRRSFRVPA